uniref:BZIP domain-containing protein n=1 Tax=Strigamia maritima TaxID=126957 RepID=T1IVW6_STRMM
MPSDAELPKWWSSPNADQHQPLDFSTKTKPLVYYPPPTSPPNFHHRKLDRPINGDTTPKTMSFFRPEQHSPPPAPHIPLNVQHFGFLDPMMGMNDSFRPVGILGGHPHQAYPFLDNQRIQPKNMRPFNKAYKDQLGLPLGYCPSPAVPIDMMQQRLLLHNNEAYADFRKNMLLQNAASSRDREIREIRDRDRDREDSEKRSPRYDEGKVEIEEDSTAALSLSPGSSPPSPSCNVSGSEIPSKKKPRELPEEFKDGAYWERRKKNNEAAKRSRDARRAREDEIAIRAAFLEQENTKLKLELSYMKNETNVLRYKLYNS